MIIIIFLVIVVAFFGPVVWLLHNERQAYQAYLDSYERMYLARLEAWKAQNVKSS